MSEVTVLVKASIIKAISHFAAKRDIRWYLQGIFVEIDGEDAYLCATNGHILAAYRTSVDARSGNDSKLSAIFPIGLFQAVKKNDVPVTLTIGANLVSVKQTDITLSGAPLAGEFPRWRKVIPSKLSGDAGQFNPEYIRDLGKVAKLINESQHNHPIIHHNGEGAAIVSLGDRDFVAVVMPMRADARDKLSLPAWATTKSELDTSTALEAGAAT